MVDAEMTGVKLSRPLVIYPIISALAILVTWLTGFWHTRLQPDGGVKYGFPLPWKTVLFLPTCNGCPLPTYYSWGFFLVDSVFYAAVEYGIVIAQEKFRRGTRTL